MKNLIILLLISSLTGYSCNSSEQTISKEYFILLKDVQTMSVNTLKDNKINEIVQYSVSEKTIYCTDGIENVAILNKENNEVKIHNFISSTEKVFTVPFELKPLVLFLKDNNLFIGGSMETEMLIQLNFSTEEWFALHVPEQVAFKDKAIDDIVFFNDMLVAVDNLIMPKYLLYYKYSEDKQCAYSHYFQLKENGTYESYQKAFPTDLYLGLYSTTYGKGGGASHISVYSIQDMSKSFAVSVFTKRGDEKHVFNDFCFIGNTLFIADNQNGLGKLENIDSYLSTHSGAYGNARISNTLIQYTVYKGEEVIGLHAVENTNKIIITLKSKKGEFRHLIYDVNEIE
jgi:hypothetical protein